MPQVTVLPHDDLCPQGQQFDVKKGASLCEALLKNGIASVKEANKEFVENISETIRRWAVLGFAIGFATLLALPVIGSNAMKKPLGTDWAWRPDLWKGPIPVPGFSSVPGKALICDGTTLFHDCRRSELTVRQIRNTREQDIAPFGFRMDVFRFDGSFLSLVLDLPEDAARGLKLRHLIRMDVLVQMEKPLEIFARLNIKHGPNVEQIVRELPLNQEEVMVEFDLAYTKVNEKRIDRLWVDLIFEGPEMNQIILRDVTLSRRPRADL